MFLEGKKKHKDCWLTKAFDVAAEQNCNTNEGKSKDHCKQCQNWQKKSTQSEREMSYHGTDESARALLALRSTSAC